MKVIDHITEFRAAMRAFRQEGKSIGLVPTMGALHAGHLSLIKKSKEQSDITVCSIFVNPIQFNNNFDLENYPRQSKKDHELLENVGCDIVFSPGLDEIYPNKDVLSMCFEPIEEVLEGEFRPGHFSGVGVIVAKLFNIVQPDQAYFGQKDLQQVAIIKKLVNDLNFQLSVVVVPTVREENGLAMSSRNQRLNTEEKEIAAKLYQIMSIAKRDISEGGSIRDVILRSKSAIANLVGMELEYFEVINSKSFEPVEVIDSSDEVSICAAVFVNAVRIIDNIYIKTSS
ncbi:MAG: pantoate--beta-alanine ligase [Reichenbachiella sp.]